MADKKQQTIFTPDEVQQQIQNAQAPAAQPMQQPAVNMNGYQPVSAVDTSGAVPQSSAWRNVMRTGNAKTDYRQILGAQPGAYQGMYQQPLNQTLNNLLNQKEFAYDVNTDALYQQIKDNYVRQGRQAMMDTQGAAAALTGGYGNSYGALAGQQAYQESLGNLSAQIPELYQLAYNRYLGNENSQRQNLAALQGLDESEYQRYQYDTQQYEQRFQDAYAKYKAATRGGGGGGITYDKFKKYVKDAMDWSDSTGGDVSNYIDQAIKVGAMNAKVGAAVKEAVTTYRNAALADKILGD